MLLMAMSRYPCRKPHVQLGCIAPVSSGLVVLEDLLEAFLDNKEKVWWWATWHKSLSP